MPSVVRTPDVPDCPPSDSDRWGAFWRDLDRALTSQSRGVRRRKYRSLIRKLERPDGPFLGHLWFRLAVTDLDVGDYDSAEQHLRRSCDEDRRHQGAAVARQMGAYRLSSLLHDFFPWLASGRAGRVGKLYAVGSHKKVALRTIAMAYDRSALVPLKTMGLDTSAFVLLLTPSPHLAYAEHSYHWAHSSISRWHTSQRPYPAVLEVPLARAVCSTLGAGMEAVLLGRVRSNSGTGFSKLLVLGHERRVWRGRSPAEAAMLLLYYFRNHIHPSVAFRRPDFPADMNTAYVMLICFEFALKGVRPLRRLEAVTHP